PHEGARVSRGGEGLGIVGTWYAPDVFHGRHCAIVLLLDDHGFSPLHWGCREGQANVVDMLMQRGARINATNRGDDTSLHLAAAHGHRDIVQMLLKQRADVNAVNEHGNTPLHYACFWEYEEVAEQLIAGGALVSIVNRYGETPLMKCRGRLSKRLEEFALKQGQDLKPVPFQDQSYLGMKTRSRDATLSRSRGIPLEELHLENRIGGSMRGDVWRGKWQGNDIVAKVLKVRELTPRLLRTFNDEFPKLRIFSHPNVLPVLGGCTEAPCVYVISQHVHYGSLFSVLHRDKGITVDGPQALHFASGVARGMAFLHSLEKDIPRVRLNSKHVMIDEERTALISMADAEFSFQEKAKLYDPQWVAPEALVKSPSEINVRSADMWSYAVLLWELSTRRIPFAQYTPMEAGMKIATEGLRVEIVPGISQHMNRLIRICMNEDPGKRPSFDQVIPILDKMKNAAKKAALGEGTNSNHGSVPRTPTTPRSPVIPVA
ncbi:unnamed protein product, partial [Cyprideis torosa]